MPGHAPGHTRDSFIECVLYKYIYILFSGEDLNEF